MVVVAPTGTIQTWLAIFQVMYAILAHLPVRNRFKESSEIAGMAIAKEGEEEENGATWLAICRAGYAILARFLVHNRFKKSN